MKLENKSTVLIIDSHKTKSISMNPKLIYAIKPLIFIFILCIAGLIAMLFFLGHAYLDSQQSVAALEHKNADIKAEVKDLKNFTSSEVERKIALLKESEIEVEELQNYLRNKGVEVADEEIVLEETEIDDSNNNSESVGGPEMPLNQRLPDVKTYSTKVHDLLVMAKQVPLGRPSDGAITSRFGYRHNPFSGKGSEFHKGLDFRGNTGDPVRTTADGEVTYSGYQNGYGNVVKVTHGYNYMTVYGHLSARSVKVGDIVKSGDLIGKLGSTGRSTGPHLHYEVRKNGTQINPEDFLTFN